MSARDWLKRGFWNTAEHGLTRVSDALTSLVLLWALTPELFSKLALAQAVVSPALLFFVSPESILYRDYSKWQSQGDKVLFHRVSALRFFAWLKLVFAVLIAFILAHLAPGEGEWSLRFSALLWAFLLALGPQVSGADREFLRMSLRLRTLNFLNLYQKLTLFLGTLYVALVRPEAVELLAVIAGFSTVTTAILGWSLNRAPNVEHATQDSGGLVDLIQSYFNVIVDALKSFSLWNHLSGVVLNWVQTMDLLFLGFFRFPAREVGLYAAVLKITGFTLALPLAFSNLFLVWLGRRHSSQSLQSQEKTFVVKFSGWMLLFSVVQCGVLYWLSPYLFEFLSRGRWSGEEILRMVDWLGVSLVGAVILGSTFILSSWLTVRSSVIKLFFQVGLVWCGFSVVLFGASSAFLGIDRVMQVRPIVFLIYALLMLVFGIRFMRRSQNQT